MGTTICIAEAIHKTKRGVSHYEYYMVYKSCTLFCGNTAISIPRAPSSGCNPTKPIFSDGQNTRHFPYQVHVVWESALMVFSTR